jgi:hypothetical protein
MFSIGFGGPVMVIRQIDAISTSIEDAVNNALQIENMETNNNNNNMNNEEEPFSNELTRRGGAKRRRYKKKITRKQRNRK